MRMSIRVREGAYHRRRPVERHRMVIRRITVTTLIYRVDTSALLGIRHRLRESLSALAPPPAAASTPTTAPVSATAVVVCVSLAFHRYHINLSVRSIHVWLDYTQSIYQRLHHDVQVTTFTTV